MGKGDRRRRRRALTAEQSEERFSTGGVNFDESLRRVLAGGPDDEHGQGAIRMTEPAGVLERELTDEELIVIWETTIAGVRDGTIRTFGDAASLREDIRTRFNL